MSALAGNAAALGMALYAAHHVGDYWVQTDHQAQHKGKEGNVGRIACAAHVATYVATQVAFMGVAMWVLDMRVSVLGLVLGLAISGITHYLADRREYGIMFALARMIPGKGAFLKLGVPRPLTIYAVQENGHPRGPDPLDNPSLGTGAWALDQSWHIFWGVFVAALVMAAV